MQIQADCQQRIFISRKNFQVIKMRILLLFSVILDWCGIESKKVNRKNIGLIG